MGRIYLDHNATTPLDREARAAVIEALDVGFGNPSSVHEPGRLARDTVERARQKVAALLGGRAEEIVFTAGGTESDNLAVQGGARAVREKTGRRTVISTPLEHPAVGASLRALERDGFRVRLLPVDGEGAVAPADLEALLDAGVALCSFALANHELGTVYPVAELAVRARAAGALIHCDAVQAAGRIPIDVAALGVDLVSISAHKLHGPKGAGALWVRRGVELAPVISGGRQEKGRRPGTENVPGIAGFGVACAVAQRELAEQSARIGRLRDRLEGGALSIPGARRFGPRTGRVPGTANLGFDGVDGELVMIALDLEGVAVSTGAACSSGSVEPSPVIRALGLAPAEARQAVRFSLGRDNTVEDVDAVLALLPEIVERIRRS